MRVESASNLAEVFDDDQRASGRRGGAVHQRRLAVICSLPINVVVEQTS